MECVSLCVWHFLSVYLVSQCIHCAIPKSLDSFLEIFLWEWCISPIVGVTNAYTAFAELVGFSLPSVPNTNVVQYAPDINKLVPYPACITVNPASQ